MEFNPKPGDLYICRHTPGAVWDGLVYLCCSRYGNKNDLFFVLFNSFPGMGNDLGQCNGGPAEWGELFNPKPIGTLRAVFQGLNIHV